MQDGQDGQDGQDTRSLVIAVLTYRRNEDILALAPELVAQADSAGMADATVLVVDNDPDGGARDAVLGLGLPAVRYVHEAQPGIAHARNRALEESADADLLVFIDDDERPEPGWLEALLRCHRGTTPVAVAGVVLPAAELIGDPWIDAGRFFVRQRHTTGATLPAASTANLLLDLRQVRELGDPRFDVRFGTTGGSDTLFTRTLVRRGGRIVWCDEAVVVDHIRTARLTRQWVLQRAFRSGNSWSRTEADLAQGVVESVLVRGRLVGVGLARILVGTLRAGLGRATGSLRHQARGSRTAARGAGMAVGALGGVYEEYRRTADKTARTSTEKVAARNTRA